MIDEILPWRDWISVFWPFNTLNIRRFVDKSFVPANQWTSVLYSRLSDFRFWTWWTSQKEKQVAKSLIKYDRWDFAMERLDLRILAICLATFCRAGNPLSALWWIKSISSPVTLLYKLMSKPTSKSFVTNVYWSYL